MRKLLLAPLLVLAAVACSVDTDDDDVRTETARTDPKNECTTRCSDEKTKCIDACVDKDDCLVACTDKARSCEVDCD